MKKGEGGQDLIVVEYSLVYKPEEVEGVLGTIPLQMFRPAVHGLWSADLLWQILHSHSWLSVRSLRVCNGSLVILRIDASLKGLELFFCMVIIGRLKSIVKGFDEVWVLGGRGVLCDWRARNKVRKSVLSKKNKKPSQKKIKQHIELWSFVLSFSF